MLTQIEKPVNLAAAFKALGDPTRLQIYEFLCSCCRTVSMDESGDVSHADGPTAGEVCCRVTGAEKISSTISFHLKELRQAGLITMDRRGKTMVCGVNPESLQALAGFLGQLEITARTQNLCSKDG